MTIYFLFFFEPTKICIIPCEKSVFCYRLLPEHVHQTWKSSSGITPHAERNSNKLVLFFCVMHPKAIGHHVKDSM